MELNTAQIKTNNKKGQELLLLDRFKAASSQ